MPVDVKGREVAVRAARSLNKFMAFENRDPFQAKQEGAPCQGHTTQMRSRWRTPIARLGTDGVQISI